MWQYLTETFGPNGPLIAMGGVGVLLTLAAMPFMLGQRKDPFSRLAAKSATRPAPAPEKEAGRKIGLRQRDDAAKKLDRFSSFLEPQDEETYSATRLKMLQAGYRSPGAVRLYHFAKFALGMGGLILGVIYALLTAKDGQIQVTKLLLSILVPGGAGYYLPIYWVERRRQTRQANILDGFPDALDLLLVCIEAGQTIDQAILRVATEIRAGFPDLADEFEIVAHEIKAGKDKTRVWRDMGERCGVPDISSFVTVLIQSATFGTSIADALRVYAAEMRDKRVMRAEEKANKLPTKLTLGTMMFTLPPLLIILIGPSIYNIAKLLGKG